MSAIPSLIDSYKEKIASLEKDNKEWARKFRDLKRDYDDLKSLLDLFEQEYRQIRKEMGEIMNKDPVVKL